MAGYVLSTRGTSEIPVGVQEALQAHMEHVSLENEKGQSLVCYCATTVPSVHVIRRTYPSDANTFVFVLCNLSAGMCLDVEADRRLLAFSPVGCITQEVLQHIDAHVVTAPQDCVVYQRKSRHRLVPRDTAPPTDEHSVITDVETHNILRHLFQCGCRLSIAFYLRDTRDDTRHMDRSLRVRTMLTAVVLELDATALQLITHLYRCANGDFSASPVTLALLAGVYTLDKEAPTIQHDEHKLMEQLVGTSMPAEDAAKLAQQLSSLAL